MGTVTVRDVEAKLRQWQSGELSASSLHAWAEKTYGVEAWEPESEAVNEVLAQLDMMDMNLLTLEDVPVLVKALRSKDYVRVLDGHFAAVDIESRKAALANDPMYAPFCK
jgi:hypothetical protein